MARFKTAFSLPVPEAQERQRRIILVERTIILPVKAALMLMLLYAAFRGGRDLIAEIGQTLDLNTQPLRYFLWLYLAFNLAVAVMLLAIRRLPESCARTSIFATCLLDGCCLAALVVITGGAGSGVYWLFVGMIVRGAAVEPRASIQLLLNLSVSACYLAACYLEAFLTRSLEDYDRYQMTGVFAQTGVFAESGWVRFMLLLLLTGCCYLVQVALRRRTEPQTLTAG